jgi:hypothetical protein
VAARGEPPRRDTSIRRTPSQFELSDLDCRTPGGTLGSTPNRTPSCTSSRPPSQTSTPSIPSRSTTGTPSIMNSRETPPPIGITNPTLLRVYSPAPMTESQPSSAGSTPAPTVDLGVGTPASPAHLTLQLMQYSQAIGANFSGPKRILNQISTNMEPPPKRGRSTPRQKVAPTLKAEALNRIVLAMSEIGQPLVWHRYRP